MTQGDAPFAAYVEYSSSSQPQSGEKYKGRVMGKIEKYDPAGRKL
jgi:hypothetical protein